MRSSEEARRLFTQSFKRIKPTIINAKEVPVETKDAPPVEADATFKIDIIEKPIKKDEFIEPFLHDYERDDAFCSIDIWIRKNTDSRPLLIVGPPGSGKTRLISEYSKNNFELYFDQDLEDFLSSRGLKKKNIGVIDCIESLDSKETLILKNNKNLRRRLILTSEDQFQEPTKTLKKLCTVVQLKEPSKKFIESVYKSRGLRYSNEPHFPIDKQSSGHADDFIDPFKCTRMLLIGSKVPELSSDIDYLITLLQTNCLQTSTNIKDISKALDRYSSLDVLQKEKFSDQRFLDSSSLWFLAESITKNSPHGKAASWSFEWPKYNRKNKEPKFLYA